MARRSGSEGSDCRPSAMALMACGGGKFSTISQVLMRNVRNGASRASRLESLILSGSSCSSIQFSTPILLTRSTSPGRGPKVSRSSACSARFAGSMFPMEASADFFFAATANRQTSKNVADKNNLERKPKAWDPSRSPYSSYKPALEKKLLAGAGNLGGVNAALGGLIFQVGGQLINVGWADIADGLRIEELLAASGSFAAHTGEQCLHHFGIVFLRRLAHNLAECLAHRHAGPVRTLVSHSIKAIGHGDNGHRQRASCC